MRLRAWAVGAWLLHGGAAPGGTNVWTNLGPTGSCCAQSLAIGPRGLYLSTSVNGVLTSPDAGQTWVEANDGLDRRDLNAIAASPSNPSILYAASSVGIYRSSNAGASWVQTSAPWGASCLAVHPEDPGVVLGCRSNTVNGTTDGGATWATRFYQPGQWTTHEVFIDPRAPSHMLLGTNFEMFRSTDGGWSWAGFTRDSDDAESIAVDTAVGGPLERIYTSEGYRSTDGGGTWSSLGSCSVGTLGAPPGAIRADTTTTPTTIWWGPCKSTNGGTSFTPSASGLPSQFWGFSELLLASASTFHAIHLGALWRSTNAGVSWTASSVKATHFGAAAASTSSPSTVVGRGNQALTRTTDGGATFSAVTGSQEFFTRIRASRANPLHFWGTSSSAAGVQRSTNGGASWTYPSGAGQVQSLSPYYPGYRPIELDPADTQTAYVHGGGSQRLLRTTDGGATFVDLGTKPGFGAGAPAVVAVSTSDPATVVWAEKGTSVAGTYQVPGGRSADRGETWTPISPFPDEVEDVVFDPTNASILYAAGLTGVHRSTDGGLTWTQTPRSPGPAKASAVAVNPQDPSEVFAVEHLGITPQDEAASRIFRSTNGGTTWIDSGYDGPRVASRGLMHVGGAPPRVYATTSAGLYELTGSLRYGDLNLDGNRDAFDLVILAGFLVGNVTRGLAPFTAPRVAADVTCEGGYDVFDLVTLAAFIVGNVPALPTCP